MSNELDKLHVSPETKNNLIEAQKLFNLIIAGEDKASDFGNIERIAVNITDSIFDQGLVAHVLILSGIKDKLLSYILHNKIDYSEIKVLSTQFDNLVALLADGGGGMDRLA